MNFLINAVTASYGFGAGPSRLSDAGRESLCNGISLQIPPEAS